MTTLAPSDDLQRSTLPLFPDFIVVQAVDYAVRRAMARLDLSALSYWWDPDRIDDSVVGAVLDFFGVAGMDTEIFGLEYRRTLLRINDILRQFRGTEFVLDTFSEETGITYTYTLTPAGNVRKTGITFLIDPPIGRVPNSEWQEYMRRAFGWMVPPDLTIGTFQIGLSFDERQYVHGGFKLQYRVK